MVSGGATIGEAFVTIRPDLSGFEQAIASAARPALDSIASSFTRSGASLADSLARGVSSRSVAQKAAMEAVAAGARDVADAMARIDAPSQRFIRDLVRQEQLVDEIANDLTRMEQAADRSFAALGSRLQGAGLALTAGFTVPLAAIGGLSLKAAVDFESSFAGIRKTMDLTEEQFASLAETNRTLAQQIPVTVNELNRIGELGGQLGIGIDNLVEFETTVAQLAVTTNLTADQAALAFAQIANVLQLPQEEIDNLGAAVVGLGNNFATQESNIVEFLQRIAGAGQIVGLTAGELAGIAAAFASLGIEAEAGGSAVQRIFLELQTAVTQGGDSLRLFAQTAGLSIQEFRSLFERDVAGAFVAFIEGLADQGTQAIATLDELGLSDIRLTRALLSAAGAGDLLNEAIAQGVKDYQENIAAQEEFNKRAATTASQFQIFRNRVNEVAIELGEALAPALLDALEAAQPILDVIGDLARLFADLPSPIQKVVLAFVGFVAIAGPALFFIGGIASGISAIGAAAQFAAPYVGALTAALGGTAAVVGGVAGALGVAAAAFISYRTIAEQAAREGDLFGATVEEAIEGGANAIRSTIQDLEQLAASLDADIASFRQAGQDTSELEAAAAELRTEIAGLREELQSTAIGAEELGLEAAAARGSLDAMANSTAGIGDAAASSAGGIRTLSEELAELSPRILATTLAANLLQQAAGVRGIGGSIELLRSTADAIGAIQQQFAQQQQIEAFADMLLRAAGAGDLARDAVEGVGGAARRATSGVADLARSVGELTSRSLALEAAQQLISRGVRSVEGAMRAIHPAALELIRDLAQSEDLAQKIADAFLGVRDSLRETASAATGGGDLLGLLASRRLAAGLDAGGGLFTPQGGGPVDQSVHIDSVTIQTTPEAVAAAADVPTLGVALRETFWGAT